MASRIYLILATTALLILGSLSILSYIAWSWSLELFAHFRFHYLVLSLILTIILFILWRTRQVKNKILFLAALLLVGINAIEVIPWYLPNARQMNVNSDKQVRVLSYNMNIKNKSYQEMINLVQNERPDIALFIEIDQDIFTKLKTALQPSLSNGFRSPGGGLAILTRLPMKDAKGESFNGQGGHNLIATLEIDKKPVKFIGTHPFVPVTQANFHRRNRQLEALNNYVQKLDQPLILAGDFNLTPWSPYYHRFVNKTKLHNTRLGFGILPSWPRPASYVNLPNWLLPLINIPIDHCFVNQHFSVARTYIGTNANSDHASLIADLVLRQ
ncbi:endonuclease/exonuclease/phosphatase family protein [Fortiea contorta]|uniref:endonuclease/exonuclease/phosphatase family protein n=1 Tax=Fortiea contorta TaxID=1892405 RepID=UPI000380FC52|nr:endonuclease/exonuclease/phosphatase family protein [Fortiea contorta]